MEYSPEGFVTCHIAAAFESRFLWCVELVRGANSSPFHPVFCIRISDPEQFPNKLVLLFSVYLPFSSNPFASWYNYNYYYNSRTVVSNNNS